jgi:hypothetical protein
MNDDSSYAPVVREKMPRIQDKDQGHWLGKAVSRFFGR